jgi:hypothetical protein
MAETKYGKYFFSGPPPGRTHPLGPIITRLDDTVAKGSYFYFVHWVLPHTADAIPVGHPPHTHKDAELLFHIGTNPDDPMDLGAEVEIYMGPELERHVFNKSTVIYIPPNFIHCPWRPLKTVRPWIFVEVNQGPMHTEKLYPQVLPEEIRNKVDWSRWKEEGFEK